MARGAGKALRILGIVVLSILILLASLLMLLLAACGLFSSPSAADRKFLAVVVVTFVAILGGGFYGIFKLAKGMSQASPGAEAAPPLPITAEEAAKLLLPLRLAIGISIGLSFLGIVLNRMEPGYPANLIPAMMAAFVLYQLPYGAVLWLTREQPERKGVALALAFSVVSVLYSLWTWGTLLLVWRQAGLYAGQIASLIDLVATGAAAYFAWQLWRRDRRSADETASLILWFIGSAVYLAIVHFAQSVAYRWVF
ncbi:MAG TPA: hypothetical protein VNK82_00635 [Terriglobales bacterium]|nr:hypothetical protein [Terriglobales bacterium]